ncbi:hypothetical protein CDAR_383291 [Caerostris darwini]|uniref:Uncharacterized protein n=1 Tax=Caerostris darwini TaxID=1538125 RepID=A0AAV4NYP6_9ARAC|nr:hypothetical protein CDAR_383291 [Caerostris darwini]
MVIILYAESLPWKQQGRKKTTPPNLFLSLKCLAGQVHGYVCAEAVNTSKSSLSNEMWPIEARNRRYPLVPQLLFSCPYCFGIRNDRSLLSGD